MFTGTKLSMNVSGSSINTGFSLVMSNLPVTYHFFVVSSAASDIAFTIATSAPTITTTDQMWCPTSGTIAIDSIAGEYISTTGMNLYARSDSGVVNGGTCKMFFKG